MLDRADVLAALEEMELGMFDPDRDGLFTFLDVALYLRWFDAGCE